MRGSLAVRDTVRALRAIGTGVVARVSPRLYVRLAGYTGRGNDPGTPRQVADYFWGCFDDYLAELGVPRAQAAAFLRDKRVLEYGPGDIPGVALLLVAHGAESVTCVDGLPLVALSPFNVAVLETLLGDLGGAERARADGCFAVPGQPRSGFAPARIRLVVKAGGLLGEGGPYALVLSRSVLEVVDDLRASFSDMRHALSGDGVMVHKVNLASHGLHRRTPLDFLTWPRALWSLMYGAKGLPNRWRVDHYRRLLAELGFVTVKLAPHSLAEREEIEAVRGRLAAEFRELPMEDLACLGFWLVARKA